jgi:hypothetical protein
LPDVDIIEPEGQLEWLQNFIKNDISAKSGDRLRALEMLTRIQDRIVTSEDEEEESDELVVKGHRILADWSLFCEVVNAQLMMTLEDGHTKDVVDALAGWIIHNPSIAKEAVKSVASRLPTTIQLKDEKESESEKIARLLAEVRSLDDRQKQRILELAAFADGNISAGSPLFEEDDEDDDVS